MKEKWLKDIQQQMADYQTYEPEGLWESIQAKMSKKNKKRSRAVLFLWTKRFAAAAAIIAFVLTLNHYFNNEKELSNVTVTEISDEEIKIIDHKSPIFPIEEESEILTIEKIKKSNGLQNITFVKNRKVSTEEVADEFFIAINEDKTDNQSETKTKENTWTVAPQPKKNQEKIVSTEELPLEAIAEVDNKSRRNRLSFGIFTSGGMGSSLSNKTESTSDFVILDTEDEEATMWKDSPLLGTLVFSSEEQVETEAKHRLPIRTGILFAYHFSNRFALESGIAYTRLISDLREGSKANYFTSEQKLHYVGLPINLKYQLFSWRGFELYSSAGILAEKNVSGTLHKTHYFDGNMMKGERENIKINPLQWSANASFGFQYNFSSLIGIYAEPSISYYFSNSTPIKTIYQDRPFNFHLNFGLRFSVGR
ncbi:outer membrane beta-barrel protein [Capnocytophaga canimorsus]|uniref:outer membrane beta-barrel protein n=1 Tax=Capnocytophaga canimorsus TaxID=28188 RepID=UPI0038582A68